MRTPADTCPDGDPYAALPPAGLPVASLPCDARGCDCTTARPADYCLDAEATHTDCGVDPWACPGTDPARGDRVWCAACGETPAPCPVGCSSSPALAPNGAPAFGSLCCCPGDA